MWIRDSSEGVRQAFCCAPVVCGQRFPKTGGKIPLINPEFVEKRKIKGYAPSYPANTFGHFDPGQVRERFRCRILKRLADWGVPRGPCRAHPFCQRCYQTVRINGFANVVGNSGIQKFILFTDHYICLLYTSDAADE